MNYPIAVILASAFLAALPALAADSSSGGAQAPGSPEAPAAPQVPGTPGVPQPPVNLPPPGQTPGTSFPQIPTSPGAAPAVPATPEARTPARVLNDVRAAVSQLPGQNPAGTLPGTEVQNARIRNLGVFRREGRIVLTGTVPTQAEKDAAGARAFQAAGEPIFNELEVR